MSQSNSDQRDSRWPALGSPEDAYATHRWARECLDMWEEERGRLLRANERLSIALAHVINRVSTEGRDDEHGHIFLVGEQAIRWAAWEIDGTAAKRAETDDKEANRG